MSEQELTQLAQQVTVALNENSLRMATVESCTGGGIARLMTDLAGRTTVFECGFVTYSNESKQRMVGVKPSTLDAVGAVSEAVASEMASGALSRANAGITVSVTGVAGPSGGSVAKPVGTVCFGWAYKEAVTTETCYFEGDRIAIRQQTVGHALQGVLNLLVK